MIDDDKDWLYLMKLQLESERFRVNVSMNGESLEEMLRFDTPDIILLDLQMQDTNGEDICRSLRAGPYSSLIKILLLSSNQNIGLVAASCGADGYISKTVSATDIGAMITDYLK